MPGDPGHSRLSAEQSGRQRPENSTSRLLPGAVRTFLDRFPAIWPDKTTLEIYASEFARLRAANTLPGPHDLWIAATALQFDIPLVTRNTAQLARVEGIRLESY